MASPAAARIPPRTTPPIDASSPVAGSVEASFSVAEIFALVLRFMRFAEVVDDSTLPLSVGLTTVGVFSEPLPLLKESTVPLVVANIGALAPETLPARSVAFAVTVPSGMLTVGTTTEGTVYYNGYVRSLYPTSPQTLPKRRNHY